MIRRLAVLALLCCVAAGAHAGPTRDDLAYDEPFFPAADHEAGVTPPDELLGFPLGERPATVEEIRTCIQTWARQSPRVRLVDYAKSHRDRQLSLLVISSENNLDRIDEIRRDWDRLWDPRSTPRAEADRLLRRTPAVAYFGYSIHGDELSCSDAALALIHHLAADQSDVVGETLRRTVVLIDPLKNPDGRARALNAVDETVGEIPTVDDQSLTHSGRWPGGRTNHYLFDMNRDWILAVTPETRGRIGLLAQWNPVLFIDSHEMGAQSTYLFTPPREPINHHLPGFFLEWTERFARRHARAFDRRGWPYYTGEWLDHWYPGYSDAWGALRGGIGVLHEQAGVTTHGVRRPSGRVVTYRQSVHQQVESSWDNLLTLRDNLEAIKRDWLESRRAITAENGPYDGLVYAVEPTRNTSRLHRFLDNLLLQGVEVHRAAEPFLAPAVDALGRSDDDRAFPAGTILIDSRQPTGPLLAAMLELDPRMVDSFVRDERESVIRDGRSEIYDVTAWNVPLLLGLDAFEIAGELPPGAERLAALPDAGPEGVLPGDAAQGWVVDGADDRTPALAIRLADAGVRVRFARRAFRWDDRDFSRGSLLIHPADQKRPDVRDILDRELASAGLAARPVSTGLGPGEVPDVGGRYFPIVSPPRIAVVAGPRTSTGGFGCIWHALDHRAGVPATYLPAGRSHDWRRYNTVVLPAGSARSLANADELRDWVERGGTLIAAGAAAFRLADEDGPSNARRLRDVLADKQEYDDALLRAFAADRAEPDQAWARSPLASVSDYPWRFAAPDRPSGDELERRDEWERRFMPRGVILAARTDPEHWLTAGAGDVLPLLFAGSQVLMAKPPVDAPVRFGVLAQDEHPDPRAAGWSSIPPERTLLLRMSGLLWPEAARRLANSAAVTRERRGRGQIILFASSPTFRGTTAGAERIFLNAVAFGHGLGAPPPIEP